MKCCLSFRDNRAQGKTRHKTEKAARLPLSPFVRRKCLQWWMMVVVSANIMKIVAIVVSPSAAYKRIIP